MESGTSASSAVIADRELSGKPRLWSVAAELLLLVFCFIFAIYSAQAEPRARVTPRPGNPAQQTQGPRDGTPPLSEPPPRTLTGEAVAIL